MINFRKQQFPHIFLPFQLQLVSDSMPGKPKILESLHVVLERTSDDRFYKMSRVESSNYSVSIICKKTKLRLEAITCSGSHSYLVLHFSYISDLLISMTIPALSRKSHADVESRKP